MTDRHLPHRIRIDEEVWQLLDRQGKIFADTPNSVLRRLLGLEGEKPEFNASRRAVRHA